MSFHRRNWSLKRQFEKWTTDLHGGWRFLVRPGRVFSDRGRLKAMQGKSITVPSIFWPISTEETSMFFYHRQTHFLRECRWTVIVLQSGGVCDGVDRYIAGDLQCEPKNYSLTHAYSAFQSSPNYAVSLCYRVVSTNHEIY